MDKSTDDLIVEFVAEGGDFSEWHPGWNIRPTDPVATVFETAGEQTAGETGVSGTTTRRLEPARWALTPGWSKTLKTKVPMFNARSEGITEKPSFRAAIASTRALIPASGYYEWQTDPVTGHKTPFLIRAANGETMAFAALYSWWKDHSLAENDPNRWTLTTTILTADAVHTLDHIHDRNPVPLPRDWWDEWLSTTATADQNFVNAAVAAAIPVAESLQIIEIAKVSDDNPLES